jgi:hypothetical protein
MIELKAPLSLLIEELYGHNLEKKRVWMLDSFES